LKFAEFVHRAPAFGFAWAFDDEAGGNPDGGLAGQDLLVGKVGSQIEGHGVLLC
jgi:hypothetical protein